MRKLIVTLVVLGLVGGGYYWLRQQPIDLAFLQGETVKVRRGDLVIPITASGNIKPASVTQIKSKASGEVIAVPYDLGATVEKGNLLVELRDVDERNNRDRAASDHNKTLINLENAQIRLEEQKTVARARAEANLKIAEARLERAKRLLDSKEAIRQADPSFVMGVEYVEARTTYEEAQAAVMNAKAELNQVDVAIRMAEQDIKAAEEAVNTARKALDDAEERLRETKIYSPLDGMVLVRNIQLGEVVQSGKTMFTGGTVLMEIADVSEIYAVVNVDEADIGQVRQLAPPSARPGATVLRDGQIRLVGGQVGEATTTTAPATLPAEMFEDTGPVEVTVETFKEEKFYGEIERISPQSENIGGIATFRVWIRITSDNREKLVGLLNTQAEAHFTAKSVQDALLVSYDAIQKDPKSEGYGVYVPDRRPDGRIVAKFVPCRFGHDNGLEIEVREGLNEGDEVYTKLPQKTRREKEAEGESADD